MRPFFTAHTGSVSEYNLHGGRSFVRHKIVFCFIKQPPRPQLAPPPSGLPGSAISSILIIILSSFVFLGKNNNPLTNWPDSGFTFNKIFLVHRPLCRSHHTPGPPRRRHHIYRTFSGFILVLIIPHSSWLIYSFLSSLEWREREKTTENRFKAFFFLFLPFFS